MFFLNHKKMDNIEMKIKKNKHILFLLPEYCEIPIGGYKVIFEYANRLVNDNYAVSIVYPSFLLFWKSSLKRKFKFIFYFFYYIFFKRKGVNCWFPLDKRINTIYVRTLNEHLIPEADFYVVTANETAYYLERCTSIPVERKIYLIQALEDWHWGREAVLKTWTFNLRKVVISPWLLSLAKELGQHATLIENGVDRPGLFKYVDYPDKNPLQVVMLYHKHKLKGCDDGLKALLLVKKQYPALQAKWFGSYKKPNGLPSWIEYHKIPSEEELNALYNESAIYLAPSHNEGFGLTLGEAMTCGCAVVCTDTGGYLTMASQGETALIVKVGDVQGMANAIITLIQNDLLRMTLARNGHEHIAKFSWANAYALFKQLFI